MNPADIITNLSNHLTSAGWQTGELVVTGILLMAFCLLATGITGIGALFMFSRIRHTVSREARRSEDLREMIAVYGQTLIAMQSSLTRAEETLTEFTSRSLEIQSQFSSNRSFEEASRVIREGGSARSLMDECGLSGVEAELMVRLHQKSEPPRRQHLKQAPLKEVAPQPEPVSAETEPRSAGENRLREALNAAGAG